MVDQALNMVKVFKKLRDFDRWNMVGRFAEHHRLNFQPMLFPVSVDDGPARTGSC